MIGGRERTNTSVPVNKMSILLHHFDLHQRHGVPDSSLLLLRWFTSHPYLIPLLYFAMQRYTTCSLFFENSSNSFDKNTVSSSFVAVWDNRFYSGTFKILVVSVM